MEISAGLVKMLREKTDAPMMDCKRALVQALEEQAAAATEETLMARGEEILRETNKLVAGKRAERSVSQGVVAVSRQPGAAAAVVLLCETDFVARNEDFQALAQTFADYFVANEPGAEPLDAVIGGKSVRTYIEDAVGQIRENIQLGSVKRVSGDGVGVYLHHDKMKAALIAVSGGNGAAGDIANKIGTQVVALSPEYISKDQIDSARLQKEIDFEKQKAIEAGKPAEMAEKIAQGKVSKEFLQQVVLLEQPWYADLSKKVAEIVGTVQVKRMVRLEAGKTPVDTSVG